MLVGEDERDPTHVGNDCTVVSVQHHGDVVSSMISLNLSAVIMSLKRNGDGVLLLDTLNSCLFLHLLQ